jgi:hypothetical protein
VVSRGKEYVFGQMLKDVAKFLGVAYDTKPKLSPQQLIDKIDMVMTAAQRFIAQIPEEQLDKNMRNRQRPIRNLCYHIFRLEEAFMDVVENNIYLTRDLLNQPPPPEIRTTKDLVEYGKRTQKRLHAWWDKFEDKTANARSTATTAASRSTTCWSVTPGIRRSIRASSCCCWKTTESSRTVR